MRAGLVVMLMSLSCGGTRWREGPREAPATATCATGEQPAAGPAAGCRRRRCPAGQLLDWSNGGCRLAEDVREIARAAGLELAPGETLTCGPGDGLLLRGSTLACVALPVLCGRDERVSPAGTCDPRPACRGGEVRFPSGDCTSVVRADGLFDLGRWTALAIGLDGGAGATSLCRTLERAPAAFGLPPDRGSTTVRLAIEVRAPDNDLSQLTARARVLRDAPTGDDDDAPRLQPLEGADAAADGALSPLVEAARRSADTTTAASAFATVSCTLRTASRPSARPHLTATLP